MLFSLMSDTEVTVAKTQVIRLVAKVEEGNEVSGLKKAVKANIFNLHGRI